MISDDNYDEYNFEDDDDGPAKKTRKKGKHFINEEFPVVVYTFSLPEHNMLNVSFYDHPDVHCPASLSQLLYTYQIMLWTTCLTTNGHCTQ